MELWKDIKGFEDSYQISNYGNVRSKDRRAINHRGGATRLVRGEDMKPWDNGNGYLVVTLYDSRRRRNRYVHRLVAEHFIENPLNKGYINHIDFNKHNNRADNLEWCSQAENVAHSIEHMKKPRAVCRKSNTGEKYITMRRGKRTDHYRVVIRNKGIDKSFADLESAVAYRSEVMKKWQIQ